MRKSIMGLILLPLCLEASTLSEYYATKMTEQLQTYIYTEDIYALLGIYCSMGIATQAGAKFLPASRVIQSGVSPALNHYLNTCMKLNSNIDQVPYTMAQKTGKHVVNLVTNTHTIGEVCTDQYQDTRARCAFLLGSAWGICIRNYIEPSIRQSVQQWLQYHNYRPEVVYCGANIVSTGITWLCHHGFALLCSDDKESCIDIPTAFSKGASVSIDLVDLYWDAYHIYCVYQYVPKLNAFH